MYGIPANTPCKIIRPNVEWMGDYATDFVTRAFKVFDIDECIIDPTGVHAFASSRNSPTIGAAWAQAGWFGFRDRDTGWVLLVEPRHLEYDGVKLVPDEPVTIDRPAVGERNGLIDGPSYHAARKNAGRVCWTEKGLKVTRLRLLSDPGFPAWDVSYCHGVLDGADVEVDLPFYQLDKGRTISSQIVEYAKEDKVYAKGLGILNAISTLN